MDDSVKKWIEKKLEEGVGEDRIKKTLKETGRDPGLVDEVQSPFEGSEKDTEDVEEEEPEEETGEKESKEETVEEEDSGNAFNLPSSIVPAIHVGRRKLFIVLVVLLIAGLGYSGFNFLDNTALSSISSISNPISPSCDRGVGVKLYSAGVSGEETAVEVYTAEKAEMVLEVYSGDSKMGETTKTIDGRGIIRADAVGDRVVFHEKGCDEPFSERDY